MTTVVLQVPWCEVDDAASERCITLFGSEVFPRVKAIVGDRQGTTGLTGV
jgi:hypothetical protein